MDFTFNTYKSLLTTLKSQGFSFQTFNEFVSFPAQKVIVLRHDVDKLPENALAFAYFQKELDIHASYYFRSDPCSWDEKIIRKIAEMGHEVGYHYEDICLVNSRLRESGSVNRESVFRKMKKTDLTETIQDNEKKIAKIAIESFKDNLASLRKIAHVETICMHGSPLSRWDNRLLWKYYNYKDYGILGEPYFDINLEDMLYLTDTGRRWNGSAVSIRDKIKSNSNSSTDFAGWIVKPTAGSAMNMTERSINFQKTFTFRSTGDLIDAVKASAIPDRDMLTIHPQRWSNDIGNWAKELIGQNLRNVIKYFYIKLKQNN